MSLEVEDQLFHTKFTHPEFQKKFNLPEFEKYIRLELDDQLNHTKMGRKNLFFDVSVSAFSRRSRKNMRQENDEELILSEMVR